MSKANTQRLPNSFFRDNPLNEQSAAMLAYAKIFFEQSDALRHEVDRFVSEHIAKDRAVRIARERQQIEQTHDPAVLIDIMRRADVIS